jgi:hypothetical protein
VPFRGRGLFFAYRSRAPERPLRKWHLSNPVA